VPLTDRLLQDFSGRDNFVTSYSLSYKKKCNHGFFKQKKGTGWPYFHCTGRSLAGQPFQHFHLLTAHPHIIFSWKVILILIGFVLLISDKNRSTGFILIGVGTFFLLQD
jgi:hypothetical protein